MGMPGTAMEDMVVTAMVDMVIQDTTEANALLMPMLTMAMEDMVGMDMVMVLTHTPMADTDTHTPMEVITTSERDLLMPNPTMVMEVMVVMVVTDMAVDTDTTVERDPLSHTTDMVVTAVDTVTDTAVDTVTDMADKKLSSLHYLN